MIAISATNPCHLYDMAVALHRRQALGVYHSGYPQWRLSPPQEFPLKSHSWRTVITYSLLRLPASLRPPPHRLYRWQDAGFDGSVAAALDATAAKIVHAMPGQALATFQRAHALGMVTVLNHASGPVRQQLALIEAEYRRAGLEPAKHHGFDAAYFAREDAEYALADFHCAASSVVRAQLERAGVDPARIWVVPYGADPSLFHPPAAPDDRAPLRVVYAGQLTQRKGLRILFDALRELRATQPVELHLYGRPMPDIASDLAQVRDTSWVTLHGAVSQARLAAAFREATVLVLPSWEEAFGLVVPQALSCGVPCVVSDRVGAADLIRPRENGSVFPAGDAGALARELDWWIRHPAAFNGTSVTWDFPAAQLIELTRKAGALGR